MPAAAAVLPVQAAVAAAAAPTRRTAHAPQPALALVHADLGQVVAAAGPGGGGHVLGGGAGGGVDNGVRRCQHPRRAVRRAGAPALYRDARYVEAGARLAAEGRVAPPEGQQTANCQETEPQKGHAGPRPRHAHPGCPHCDLSSAGGSQSDRGAARSTTVQSSSQTLHQPLTGTQQQRRRLPRPPRRHQPRRPTPSRLFCGLPRRALWSALGSCCWPRVNCGPSTLPARPGW